MPRISVIIPTHDRPRLLLRAVESARTAATDVEIIVVDDASVDETRDVCRNLADISYVRAERNQGVAGARNIGILNSTGPYIAFLDDDDLRLPGSLDLQADLLDRNPGAGFVCGAMIMADQSYRPTGEVIQPRGAGDVFWELLELDFPVMPLCTLLRKECFLRVGLLKGHIDGIDDWDIFTRIAELYSVLVTDQPVGIYRQPTTDSGQGSSRRAAQLRLAASHQLELLKLERPVAAPDQARRARRRMIRRIAENLVWTAATQHLPAARFAPAFANVAVALDLDPLIAFRPSCHKALAKKLLEKIALN
jgi:glycosyltransferase involved in cell wall biosynthesis